MLTFIGLVLLYVLFERVAHNIKRSEEKTTRFENAALWQSAVLRTQEIAACTAGFLPRPAPVAPVKYSASMERAIANLEAGNLTYVGRKPSVPDKRGVEVQPVYFKTGEPQTFDEFGSQPAVLEELRDAIKAMAHTDRMLVPQMFLGPAGLGKTLLAKVLANELQLRATQLDHSRVYFFELLSYDIDTAERLDEVIKHAEAVPGCVVFIDEIHGLPRAVATKLYTVLEEHRYAYQGELLRGLAPFTLVAATTDFGLLEAPMQRRWVRHQLERNTIAQLQQTIERRSLRDVPLEPEALDLLLSRVKQSGAPWEAVRLYNLSATAAKAGMLDVITEDLVESVMNRYGIDENGLDRYDRQCIKAILTQPFTRAGSTDIAGYRCSEEAVAAIAGVDKAYYRDTIKPKLMSRGMLVVRSGQMLTPKAVELYHDLI